MKVEEELNLDLEKIVNEETKDERFILYCLLNTESKKIYKECCKLEKEDFIEENLHSKVFEAINNLYREGLSYGYDDVLKILLMDKDLIMYGIDTTSHYSTCDKLNNIKHIDSTVKNLAYSKEFKSFKGLNEAVKRVKKKSLLKTLDKNCKQFMQQCNENLEFDDYEYYEYVKYCVDHLFLDPIGLYYSSEQFGIDGYKVFTNERKEKRKALIEKGYID